MTQAPLTENLTTGARTPEQFEVMLNDDSLNWSEKGLLVWITSRGRASLSEVMARGNIGITAARALVRGLEAKGRLVETGHRKAEGGRFQESRYEVKQ